MAKMMRNPNDATFRNVRAAKARINSLETTMGKRELTRSVQAEIATIKQRLDNVETTLHELFAGFEAALKTRPQTRRTGRRR